MITKLRSFLTQKEAEMRLHALITRRLDSCNSFYVSFRPSDLPLTFSLNKPRTAEHPPLRS